MDHKTQFEALNKDALEKLEKYMQTRKDLPAEHQEKYAAAKDDWQVSWNKLMETLLMLERLEI